MDDRALSTLRGLHVVELASSIPAAWCGRQFAQWGADVVARSNSPLRSEPPIADGVSLLWLYVSEGKRLAAEPAIAGADVVIADHPLDAPNAVVVLITPFGTSGPYASYQGTDLIVQALSGYMSLNGLAPAAPLKAPANIGAYACGTSAFVAALAAVREREASGRGQVIDVSCMDQLAAFIPTLRTQYYGVVEPRVGGPITGARLFRCADGWMSLHAALIWRTIVDALLLCGVDVPADLEQPEVGAEDPFGFVSAGPILAPYIAQARAADLENAIRTVDERAAIWVRLREVAEVLHHPQAEARGLFRNVGGLRVPGPAGSIAIGAPSAPLKRAASPGDAPPLDGVRVIDFTQAWVGPYASQLLADLGADVIKIESHRRPDIWRYWKRTDNPPTARPDAHPANTSIYFNSVNRNKRSLTLDLKCDAGREIALELVRRADIVLENYTPKVMSSFGLGYDDLRRVKPDIVMTSFSGYGGSGPSSPLMSNGMSTAAVSGWDAMLGYPGGDPMHTGFYQADPITGLQMAALALVALALRDATGASVRVDGSMFESAVGYIGEQHMAASLGLDTPRIGNRHPAMAPHGAFPCAGYDRWVAIAVRDDRDWRALVRVSDGALDDPRFASAEVRLAEVDDLEARVASWTSSRRADDVAKELQSAGVPAGIVQTTQDYLSDAHLHARGFLSSIEHADAGTQLYAGAPWRFSRSRAVPPTPPVRLGEHSAEILRELGRSDDEITQLFADDVTGQILDAADQPLTDEDA